MPLCKSILLAWTIEYTLCKHSIVTNRKPAGDIPFSGTSACRIFLYYTIGNSAIKWQILISYTLSLRMSFKISADFSARAARFSLQLRSAMLSTTSRDRIPGHQADTGIDFSHPTIAEQILDYCHRNAVWRLHVFEMISYARKLPWSVIPCHEFWEQNVQ